ncbi:hypothetical protein QQF64_018501 [Cirrhinus molitorella]|uniref:Galectin n=1 Tax=Cirrhinus molitorella TaxID=172907 RepID=A0ABR3LEC4_9TELE
MVDAADKVIIIIQGVIYFLKRTATRMGMGPGGTFRTCRLKEASLSQVTICCSPDNYEVFVNGGLAHTYNHRYTELQEIDVLEINGNVQLSFVQP